MKSCLYGYVSVYVCVPVNVWMFWRMHTKELTVVISGCEIMGNIYFILKKYTIIYMILSSLITVTFLKTMQVKFHTIWCIYLAFITIKN